MFATKKSPPKKQSESEEEESEEEEEESGESEEEKPAARQVSWHDVRVISLFCLDFLVIAIFIGLKRVVQCSL